jgi:aryl-alcohol dehydrogenase-like predicted oxidoreductase
VLVDLLAVPESKLESRIPRVIVGTARLGSVVPDALVSPSDRARVFAHLDAMLEAGCSAFDIAASYQLGGTERIVGRWTESRRNRDRLFLITKGGHPYPVVQPHRITPKALADDLNASLRRLKTERVDLYLLHRDDPSAPLEPILESLASFQRAGKIGAWGVSNWSHERIGEIDALARTAGVPSVSASSPHFSLAEWKSVPWKGCVSIAGESNREARAFYARAQLPVLAWSPLGRGFFSAGAGENDDRVYASPSNAARRQRAQRLADKYGVSAAQIALAYLLRQPFPVFAVVAASTAQKMKDNLAAADLQITDEEIRWLESGEQNVRASAP